MSLQICSLNSGSNGNCYYIGNSSEAVLIDAGLSARETERRMKLRGLSVEKVKAIFVSHEHADHISGVPGLSKKHQLSVYITGQTLRNSNIPIEEHLVNDFRHAQPIVIGSLKITPFKKSHDAADPHSFVVSGNSTNVGIITDIGFACKRVLKYFSQCHAAFLESNYCDEMLRNGSYPYHLQERIRGDEGHLSNAQALELFQHYKSPELQLLILSHLSKNNNKPELVERIFSSHAGNTKIVIASRYEAGEVFNLEKKAILKPTFMKNRKSPDKQQLSLF
ncbi:MAG TPA: MBL fold metallo-hydrolase [Chitinophagaceae bacterium]|jgi:phosphoribosyl 1,2-cyclic phosphodiesterase|nr:MBL fold metallo-hydrolase [Chitinophagaceae bacterium]